MELPAGAILGFVLILTRIGAFFAASPLFSWQAIPIQSKVTIALILAAFFAAITPFPAPAASLNVVEALLMITDETFYGLALGLVAYSLLAVIRVAGGIIEQQIGLTMASVMDPFTDEEGQPIGTLIELIFVMLLLQTEGHHLLLQILNRTFEGYQPGMTPTAAALAESVLKSGSAMMMLALQMSAPILATFLLLMVVLAFLARIAPESNILFMSFPLRCGLGMLMVGIFLPYMAAYLKQFTLWLNRLIPL
jgi:flagellar biosynthetic protein FliR